MLTTEQIEALEKPYLPGAERAYEECMAGFRHQEEVFKGLEQKATLLFSVLVTVLAGLVAVALQPEERALAWAAGAAVLPALGALISVLMAMRTRDFWPPFTGPEHWVHAAAVKDESGLAKTYLHLASYVDGWEKRNKATNAAKAKWINCTLVLIALCPVAGATAGVIALFLG